MTRFATKGKNNVLFNVRASKKTCFHPDTRNVYITGNFTLYFVMINTTLNTSIPGIFYYSIIY